MDAFTSQQPARMKAARIGGLQPSGRLAAIAGSAVLLLFALYLTIWSLSAPREGRQMPSNAAQVSASEALKVTAPLERQALRERETNALRSDPLDPMALKNLSDLWRAEDDGERAERLAVLAGDRNLRNLPAQAEVLDILLRRKDFAAALYRLDALMRE